MSRWKQEGVLLPLENLQIPIDSPISDNQSTQCEELKGRLVITDKHQENDTEKEPGPSSTAAEDGWTNPSDSDWSNLKAPDKFVTLQSQLRYDWSTRNQSRYTKIQFLHVSWEESDLKEVIDAQVDRYRNYMGYLYMAETDTFAIPSHTPKKALTRRLVEWTEHDNSETLFILWYDGHGGEHPDKRGAPTWMAWNQVETAKDPERRQDHRLDSSAVINVLGNLEGDVLLVFNACCSMTGYRTDGPGIVECITPSTYSSITDGYVLADQMEAILNNYAVAEKGISVVELHAQLVGLCQPAPFKTYTDEMPSCEGIAGESHRVREWSNRTIPVHTRLSPDGARGGKSIVLSKPRDNSWSAVETYPRLCKRVTIELDMEAKTEVNVDEWREWLLAAPSQAFRVDITEGSPTHRDGTGEKMNEETCSLP